MSSLSPSLSPLPPSSPILPLLLSLSLPLPPLSLPSLYLSQIKKETRVLTSFGQVREKDHYGEQQ